MKVGVISNNDLCLPLLFYLGNNKAEVNLYLGKSSVIDPGREEVQRYCVNYNIAYTDQSAKNETVYQWMNEVEPDLVFVIGHRQKIDLKRTKSRFGIFNIHFGKLPQFRGASPLFWQLRKMESTLVCCIHALSEEMDAGPVYWEKEIRNEDHFSHHYIQYLFSNLILEGINDVVTHLGDSSFKPREQDEVFACWYPKPSLNDVLIRWDLMSANEICSLVRACNSWNAGAITLYQGMELKIIDASYVNADSSSAKAPGTITAVTDSIKISCTNQDELSIHYLSLNGIPFAGRLAKKFGIVEGERLSHPSD